MQFVKKYYIIYLQLNFGNFHNRREKSMDEEKREFTTYNISLNCIESGTFFNIPHRRWIEAVIFTIIVIVIIKFIPFTTVVGNVLCITLGAPTFGFFLKGIKNRSVTEMILAEIRFRRNRRVLHLRGPEFKKEKQDFSKYAGGDETNAERFIRRIKELLNGYADKVLEESDSSED